MIGDEGGGDDADVVGVGDAGGVGDLLVVYADGDPALAGILNQSVGDAAAVVTGEEDHLADNQFVVGDRFGDDPRIGWNEGFHGESGTLPRLGLGEGGRELIGTIAEGPVNLTGGGVGIPDGQAFNVGNRDRDGRVLTSTDEDKEDDQTSERLLDPSQFLH